MVNRSEVIKILSNLDPRHPKGPKKTKKFLSCKIVTITSSKENIRENYSLVNTGGNRDNFAA